MKDIIIKKLEESIELLKDERDSKQTILEQETVAGTFYSVIRVDFRRYEIIHTSNSEGNLIEAVSFSSAMEIKSKRRKVLSDKLNRYVKQFNHGYRMAKSIADVRYYL